MVSELNVGNCTLADIKLGNAQDAVMDFVHVKHCPVDFLPFPHVFYILDRRSCRPKLPGASPSPAR